MALLLFQMLYIVMKKENLNKQTKKPVCECMRWNRKGRLLIYTSGLSYKRAPEL